MLACRECQNCKCYQKLHVIRKRCLLLLQRYSATISTYNRVYLWYQTRGKKAGSISRVITNPATNNPPNAVTNQFTEEEYIIHGDQLKVGRQDLNIQ
jgi:hypothetical protein